MSSEPISGLPAGNPADAYLLPQSTGASGATQKITQLQFFDYVALKATNNVVYVNSANGVDSVGRGTVLTPYATLSYALSQITTATISSPFLIEMFGSFTETTLELKPNIYISGNNSYLTVTNQVVAHSSWNSATGALFFKDFVNVDFQAGMLLDLSTASFAVVEIQNINCNTTQTFKIKGDGAGAGTTIAILNNIYGFSNIPSIEVENCYGGISGGAPTNITAINSSSATDYVITLNDLQALGNVLLKSTATKNLLVSRISCNFVGTVTLDGVNVTLNSDVSNNEALFLNGATEAQITYRNLASTLTSGFNPTSYTALSEQVKGHLQGIDNALNIGNGRVVFGLLGGGITGDSAFTYDSSSKRLSVNNLRALSANIAGLNGSGYYEVNSAVDVVLTNNPPIGPYTKIYAVFTATGKKIILPDSTEPFAIQASNGGSILIANESPTIPFQIQTFLGDIIYTLQPLESVNIWISDNPTGSYFVQNFNSLVDSLSYGDGYHEINDGVSYVATNPMPTFINVTDAGSGLSITLPNMLQINSLKNNELPIFYIYNNGNQAVNVLNYSSAAILTINPKERYVFVVKSNSTSNGDFYFTKIPNIGVLSSNLLVSTDSNSNLKSISVIDAQNLLGVGDPMTRDEFDSLNFNMEDPTDNCNFAGNRTTGTANFANMLYVNGTTATLGSAGDFEWDDFSKTLILRNSTSTSFAGIKFPNPNTPPTTLNTYSSSNIYIVNASGPWSTRTVTIQFTRIGNLVQFQWEDIASATITSVGNQITIPAAVPPSFRAVHDLKFPIKIYYGATNTDLASGDLYISSSTGDIIIAVINNQVFNAGFAGWPESSLSWLVP